MSKLKILTKGILKENPVLVLVLGTCPTLGVTTMASNGLGMGIATMMVLLCSNVVISLLKKVIPDKVRIPCYITVIASFVTVVGFLVKAYTPDLDSALGVFLPLIVVNCIILGRAEMFASKNSVVDSALDGIGMGLGFTVALLFIGSVREILGSGTWFGITLTANVIEPMGIFQIAAGGFFVFGVAVAIANKLTKGRVLKNRKDGCAGCPAANACAKLQDGGEETQKGE